MNAVEVKAAADAIRAQIDPDFEAKIAYDPIALADILAELRLTNTPANQFQVKAALFAKGIISTRQKYPKMRYHEKQSYVIVENQAEEDALGEGWLDAPHPDAVGPGWSVPQPIPVAPPGTVMQAAPKLDPHRKSLPPEAVFGSTAYAEKISAEKTLAKDANAQNKAAADKAVDDRADAASAAAADSRAGYRDPLLDPANQMTSEERAAAERARGWPVNRTSAQAEIDRAAANTAAARDAEDARVAEAARIAGAREPVR